MTPSIHALDTVTHEDALEPATKRRKLGIPSGARLQPKFNLIPLAQRSNLEEDSVDEHQDCEFAIYSHPLDVRPLGNEYGGVQNIKTCCGQFAVLPDEVLLQLLEYLDAPQLVHLGSSCKALYAFCRSDDLWKTLFVQYPPLNFRWQDSWRDTYLSIPHSQSTSISCRGLFSDALYRPFQCANVNLTPFARNIPSRNQIARLTDLTLHEFTNDWASTPFILTSPVKNWPIYRTWDIHLLLSQYGDSPFRAESVDWPLSTYVDYMRTTTDESPLYLFDRAFASKMDLRISPSASASYTPPSCFGTDLFAVLGHNRPDSSWLIIGPPRSGSTFHKDPNGTSAWNAVIRGSKYWIMFPSSSSSRSLPPPPGVYTSADQSEVTSPLSIAEWLLTFHAEARATPGCKEGVCGEGEILHVPSGWFHLVVNLEEAIAVTQNFVPGAHLTEVLGFLRDQKDQVSGFGSNIEDPYNEFVECLRREQPDLLEGALAELERRTKKKGWEHVVGESNEGEVADGFSFDFGGDEDEDEDGEESDRDIQ